MRRRKEEIKNVILVLNLNNQAINGLFHKNNNFVDGGETLCLLLSYILL